MPGKKIILFLGGSTLFIVFFFYAYQILYTPNILVDQKDRFFIIPSGTTFADLQQDLLKGGFVNDLASFSFLARLRGYDTRILPGRYRLRGNMTNLQAIRTLRSGMQEPVRVTFSYARKVADLGETIAKNLALSPADFYAAVTAFVAAHKEYNEDNILALFIPNTYEVYYTITPQNLMQRFYREYRLFWNQSRLDKAKKIGLTPLEVSVLASIVQAETMHEDEAPTVAGLYLNRLKKDMPLQADPTLVYAVGDFSLKRVLNKHKEIDSPYNTYRYRGLPPGPINMPRIAMIDATLNPARHDYIYMCARDDFSGYHAFSTTLQQHLVYARNYQRALTAEQRKARALRATP